VLRREGSGREEVWETRPGLEEGERLWVWSVDRGRSLEDVEDGYSEGPKESLGLRKRRIKEPFTLVR
jgi:hypothetical protein